LFPVNYQQEASAVIGIVRNMFIMLGLLLGFAQPVSAAEYIIKFNGYVDGVNPALGSQVQAGDKVRATLRYTDSGLNIINSGTYRYYGGSFLSGTVRIGNYRIDIPDNYGLLFTQNSPGGAENGPDRLIFQFSNIFPPPLNGNNLYGLNFIFDDGSGYALSNHVIPTKTADLAGFQNAPGMIADFGPQGSYRIGGVFTRFSIMSAVPEPSTWIMMIFGIGIVGWAVRQRNICRLAAHRLG
jgi:hypothetical protein